MRGSALRVLGSSPDRTPAPPATSCSAQTWPYREDHCLLGTPRTPQAFQERFPDTKPRAAPAPPATHGQVAGPNTGPQPTQPSEGAPPAAAQPAPLSRAEATATVEHPKDAQQLLRIDQPSAGGSSMSSEALSRKARQNSVARRAREPARPNPDPRTVAAERQNVIGEVRRNGSDRLEPTRNEGSRQSSNPIQEPPRERRGFFWCLQPYGHAC